jgi:3-phenylpropionate/trans-cinnamate dioxygenase ferredoxin reductase subunit
MPDDRILIVGANLAGSSAANALRRGGYKGEIVLIGDEPYAPYRRPPLSKEFLLHEVQEEQVYLRRAGYYDQQRITLRLGERAVRLDTNARTVELQSGEQVGFDQLLIATGASVRRLRVPGAELAGVHYLRTLDDATGLRAELTPGRRVVVIGAGFIGAEIAAACRERGLEVTLVEMLSAPLQQALGETAGAILGRFHRERGVELVMGERVQALRGGGRVEAVVTASGRELPCDVAVVGVGVAPSVEWLTGSGVELDNGVVVDEFCRTNLPGIFAAGDVANTWHPLLQERLRVEHETNAQNQGMTAARNMLGMATPYAPVPFVWSDQYDLQLQYVGHADPNDAVVLRGGPASRSFTAFYLRRNELRAALGVNRSEEVETVRGWLQARAAVPVERLTDESVPLSSLVTTVPA